MQHFYSIISNNALIVISQGDGRSEFKSFAIRICRFPLFTPWALSIYKKSRYSWCEREFECVPLFVIARLKAFEIHDMKLMTEQSNLTYILNFRPYNGNSQQVKEFGFVSTLKNASSRFLVGVTLQKMLQQCACYIQAQERTGLRKMPIFWAWLKRRLLFSLAIIRWMINVGASPQCISFGSIMGCIY